MDRRDLLKGLLAAPVMTAAAQDKQLTPAADAAARLSETIAGVQPTT